MVTQAPATAFACFQLAPLAQKKRCLSTATQSLGVFVRCRQSRPPSEQRKLAELACVSYPHFVFHRGGGLQLPSAQEKR